MGQSVFLKTGLAAALLGTWLAGPAQSEAALGAYLAGRQAVYAGDFEDAARYYTRALMQDPQNLGLLESVALSNLALGRLDTALPVAQRLEASGARSQAAHMIVVAGLVRDGDFEALEARDPETVGIGPLVDGLINAWALLGLGETEAGLAQFDTVGSQGGLKGFADYHKALALASIGDFEAAEALYAGPETGRALMTRRGALARAEILSQLGRNDDALDVLTDAFGTAADPGLTDVIERLEAGETLPFTHVTSASDGIAEVFFSVGGALTGDAADEYALLYARMAQILRPDHVDAILLSADLLDQLEQYDLAVEAYREIPADSPDFHAAELGRAEALRRAGKPDAAIEVMQQLARAYPTLPSVHMALGNALRQQEDYAGAVAAYDTALTHSEDDARNRWFIHYARGICHERLDQWDAAEADFRAALALNPDQPQVLNYLGYSLVEQQVKLDEALDMIERAVAARPDSGYIVDSLGWVLFRLGRYDEAVEQMEAAVELMPVDPVVNDHLGDVYWAVSRYREAEFQWKRALSFIDPDDTDGEADPDRIRRKLEVGLDTVLAEEGAPPLEGRNGAD
ncbi:MAG: tetratricopeptide repeat protein [Marinibacterium sp.]|nr:tetratricopeptide repeat protein [Marinibacterium sp.]